MSLRRFCPGCETAFPKITRKPTSWCPDDLRLIYCDKNLKNKRKQDFKRMKRLAYIVNLFLYARQVIWELNKSRIKANYNSSRIVYCNHILSFPNVMLSHVTCCKIPDIIASITKLDHLGNTIPDAIDVNLLVECALVGKNDFYFVYRDTDTVIRDISFRNYQRTPLFSTYYDAYKQMARLC